MTHRLGAKRRLLIPLTLLLGGALMASQVLGAVAPPPPNALEIMWPIFCQEHPAVPECQASPTPSPSTTPTSTPTASPSPTPTATTTPTTTPTASPPPTPSPTPTAPPSGGFILIAQTDLMALPTSGAAWQGVLTWAAKTPDVLIGDLNSNGDIIVLAKALEYARIGTASRRTEAIAAFDKLRADTGIPDGDEGRALELSRGVGAYVLAADLLGYRDPAFLTWVGQQATRATNDKTITTCATGRPNNWGTWCRSSLLIIHLYLGQSTTQDVAMFRGYLGDRAQYAGFSYGDLRWQANPSLPVGINPAGSTRNGFDVDGVLPDDQRRDGGGNPGSPGCQNYVAEALQGVTLEAIVLARAGSPSWTWSDSAIGRAVAWKYRTSCPFTGDDSFVPFVTDAIYGTSHAGSSPAQPGKGSGFYDWLFQ